MPTCTSHLRGNSASTSSHSVSAPVPWICKMRRAVPFLFALAVLARITAATEDARLIDAAKAGRGDVIRALLQQHVDVNAREADGTTALHWVVRVDDVDSARLLIRAGASVGTTNRYGVAPLALAAANGSPRMIRLLL